MFLSILTRNNSIHKSYVFIFTLRQLERAVLNINETKLLNIACSIMQFPNYISGAR